MLVESTELEAADALQRLLSQIQAHEQTALGRLYDLTVDRVYTIALRVLGDAQDAEEAVADVYAQVWDKAASFDPGRGGVMAWLVMISHSRAIDRRRRRAEPAAMVRGDDAERALAHEACEQTASADLVSLLQSGSALRRALADLGAVPRQLIGLAFMEDLSHQEIAERTRLPLGTVKSHIRRGLQQLRESLQTEGIDAA